MIIYILIDIEQNLLFEKEQYQNVVKLICGLAYLVLFGHSDRATMCLFKLFILV